jgi:thiamine-monophosphate kinase
LSRLALRSWQAGRPPSVASRERFVRPPSRHAAARYLAAHGARAMIDLSDGLASDLGHLLAAGGVGATVTAERIPAHPEVADAATAEEPAWSIAAASGEEYELLAALPPATGEEALSSGPVPMTVIGVVEAEPGLRATLHGRPVRLPAGWDHFRTP